jgi:hypothetical protein
MRRSRNLVIVIYHHQNPLELITVTCTLFILLSWRCFSGLWNEKWRSRTREVSQQLSSMDHDVKQCFPCIVIFKSLCYCLKVVNLIIHITEWDFRLSRWRVWSSESSGMYCQLYCTVDINLRTQHYIPEDSELHYRALNIHSPCKICPLSSDISLSTKFS